MTSCGTETNERQCQLLTQLVKPPRGATHAFAIASVRDERWGWRKGPLLRLADHNRRLVERHEREQQLSLAIASMSGECCHLLSVGEEDAWGMRIISTRNYSKSQ
eukprot:COSAG05_NODE_10317_length_572_cov_0.805497_2_plen_104_part_01